jgi:ribosomal-protein-alanine N-acetyltransferase
MEKGDGGRFRFVAMDGEGARAIAGWRYAGEYAFYDLVNDPDDLAEFLAPENWGGMYHAALDEGGELVGFLQAKGEGNTVEIGLGLRPDLTGQGLGRAFVLACLDFARERFHPERFRLAVAAFNRRAISVYGRAGFRATGEYRHRTNGGEHRFVRMEREA